MFGKKDVLQVATHTPSASAQRALLDLPSPYNLFALAPIHGLVRNPHLDPEIWDEIYHDDKACEYGSMKYLLHNAPDDDRAMLITEQGALTRWDTLEMGIPNLSAAGWQRFINQAVFTELRFDTYNAACCIISGNLAPDLALSLWQEIAKDASSESLYKNSPASYAAAFATLAMSYDLLTDAQVASEFTTRPPFSQVHNEFLTPKTAQMLIKRPGVLALLSHTANAEFFTRNLTEFTQTSTSTPAPQLLSAQYVTTELTPVSYTHLTLPTIYSV